MMNKSNKQRTYLFNLRLLKFDEPRIKIALQTLFSPKPFSNTQKIEIEQSSYTLSIYRKNSENRNRTKAERIIFSEPPKVWFVDPELLLFPRTKLGGWGVGRETWGVGREKFFYREYVIKTAGSTISFPTPSLSLINYGGVLFVWTLILDNFGTNIFSPFLIRQKSLSEKRGNSNKNTMWVWERTLLKIVKNICSN
jgi:hypothetical protein